MPVPRHLRPLASLLFTLGINSNGSAAPQISITHVDHTIRVEIDAQLFTEYHYDKADRPYFYPVNGPRGDNLTRNWPMTEAAPGEETDHKHHRGLWYTHGLVNGYDFWTEGKGPKIVQDKIVEVKSGNGRAYFTTQSSWVAGDGTRICTDTRKHIVHADNNTRSIDIEITFHASEGPVTLGDTKEGSMAIRLPATMRVKGKVGKGKILNSAGDVNKKAWGKRAEWCYYSGPVDGHQAGVAIFDHPTNPRHPTWWHVRDYGLFAANPFGLKYFEKKSGKKGDMKIAMGDDLTFRYRIFLHQGNPDVQQIRKAFTAYAKEK